MPQLRVREPHRLSDVRQVSSSTAPGVQSGQEERSSTSFQPQPLLLQVRCKEYVAPQVPEPQLRSSVSTVPGIQLFDLATHGPLGALQVQPDSHVTVRVPHSPSEVVHGVELVSPMLQSGQESFSVWVDQPLPFAAQVRILV